MNIQEKRIVDGTRSWRNREEAIKSKIESAFSYFLYCLTFHKPVSFLETIKFIVLSKKKIVEE